MFHNVFSSCFLGWRNLFLDLPKQSNGTRLDAAHTDLVIGWRSYQLDPKDAATKATGLIALPSDPSHSTFLDKWIFNPGLLKTSATSAELTFAMGATKYADLVSVSGHGAAGTVWGDATGGYCSIDLGSAAVAHAGLPTNGTVKYILIPSCYNLSGFNADTWLPVHQKPQPIHGVLGYSGSYAGGRTGAKVMFEFGKLMKQNRARQLSIFEAWRQANRKHGQPWGATILEDAKGDTMQQWISAAGLSIPSGSAKVLHFDDSSYPAGTEVTGTPPDFEAIFHTDAGTPITFPNNGPTGALGLVPGRDGHLLLRGNGSSNRFPVGGRGKLVFFYYRPNKDGMNLDKLLTFSAPTTGGTFTRLTDANKQDGTTHVDAIEYTFAATETSEAKIPYKVNADAAKHYKVDSAGGTTHGYFYVDFTPPGSSNLISMYRHGAWLRDP
jgi:hypothetical protein